MSPEKTRAHIAFANQSHADDTALITHLVTLINTVYDECEKGYFHHPHVRTSVEEIRGFITAGEFALAWKSSAAAVATASTSSDGCDATRDVNADDDDDGDDDLVISQQPPPPPPAKESLLGCMRIHALNTETTSFGLLVVSPSAQGIGIGKDLVYFAETYCRARPRSTTTTTTTTTEQEEKEKEKKTPKKMQCDLLLTVPLSAHKARVQAWYEKLGYRVVTLRDFAAVYPHLAPELAVEVEYRLFEKELVGED